MSFAGNKFHLFVPLLLCVVVGLSGCSGNVVDNTAKNGTTTANIVNAELSDKAKVATITIEPGSAADAVRIFYQNLRERKYREAIYQTNLRSAVEGLSENELKEFSVDFDAIGRSVPADVQINGEIVTGDKATVTLQLPVETEEKPEIQQIRLRKEKNAWIILTADEADEKRIRKEGKRYLYTLRIETHQDEAKAMLDRIAKAQVAFATQNGGVFADIPALIGAGFLPEDVTTAESTGYNYAVTLKENNTDYYATATPADYRKSGVMSYLVVLVEKNTPSLSSKDNGGKVLTP